jgi:3-isopropylmalate dehydrogenase
MVFFRGIFDERARLFPGIEARHRYVDAMALDLIKHPWAFDVMVTENMYGDILSDLAAGLMGGLGMAPSGDIGHDRAVFQPCHGSAPDIAGQGKANPTATFLSAAMMLDWLGERHDAPKAEAAARLIQQAVDAAYAGGGLKPCEFGGPHGTAAVTQRVLDHLKVPA